MSFFISYPLSALVHISSLAPIRSRADIMIRADKRYDMQNDVIIYIRHILEVNTCIAKI
jgi:hypothetical protein